MDDYFANDSGSAVFDVAWGMGQALTATQISAILGCRRLSDDSEFLMAVARLYTPSHGLSAIELSRQTDPLCPAVNKALRHDLTLLAVWHWEDHYAEEIDTRRVAMAYRKAWFDWDNSEGLSRYEPMSLGFPTSCFSSHNMLNRLTGAGSVDPVSLLTNETARDLDFWNALSDEFNVYAAGYEGEWEEFRCFIDWTTRPDLARIHPSRRVREDKMPTVWEATVRKSEVATVFARGHYVAVLPEEARVFQREKPGHTLGGV